MWISQAFVATTAKYLVEHWLGNGMSWLLVDLHPLKA